MKIFYPKPGVYKNQSSVNIVVGTGARSYEYKKIEYTYNGIEVHFKDALFPHKGIPNPEAVQAINSLKVGLLLPLAGIPLSIDKIIYQWSRLKTWTCDKIELKEEYYCPVAREARKGVTKFLNKIGKPTYSDTIGEYFALILQYDDAYRYRFQDAMNEIVKQNLIDKPIRELLRVLKIIKGRDWIHIYNKTSTLVKILIIFLLIPKYRKAFKETVLKVDVHLMQMDQADRYWCLNRGDYPFFGQSTEERQLEWLFIHNFNPPKILEFTIKKYG